MSSLLGSSRGSDLKCVNLDLEGVFYLDHDLLSDEHHLVHVLSLVVSSVGQMDPSLAFLDEVDLSLDGKGSLAVGDLAEVERDLVGLLGTVLEMNGVVGSLGSDVFLFKHRLVVDNHHVSVGDRLSHGEMS